MPRLKHYDDEARGTPQLCCGKAVIDELDRARVKHGFCILGYVLMPDHLHLVIFLPDGMKLGLVVREIKSRSAKHYFAEAKVAPDGETRAFWQRRAMITIAGRSRRCARRFAIVMPIP